jgi:dihydroorotate dehydrogenase electron transfer subunit
MRYSTGKVVEILLDVGGLAARVECPPQAVPAPGQYLMAYPLESHEALATALTLAETTSTGFLTGPAVPRSWTPGMQLELRGPLGTGFRLPASARRVALAGLDTSAARLLPLLRQALERGAAVALFSHAPAPRPPASVELSPLDELPAALPWADFLALDLPQQQIPTLRGTLGLGDGERLSCAAQALVQIEMPCSGLAACGACALLVRNQWKLACEDGPVFDLQDLL